MPELPKYRRQITPEILKPHDPTSDVPTLPGTAESLSNLGTAVRGAGKVGFQIGLERTVLSKKRQEATQATSLMNAKTLLSTELNKLAVVISREPDPGRYEDIIEEAYEGYRENILGTIEDESVREQFNLSYDESFSRFARDILVASAPLEIQRDRESIEDDFITATQNRDSNLVDELSVMARETRLFNENEVAELRNIAHRDIYKMNTWDYVVQNFDNTADALDWLGNYDNAADLTPEERSAMQKRAKTHFDYLKVKVDELFDANHRSEYVDMLRSYDNRELTPNMIFDADYLTNQEQKVFYSMLTTAEAPKSNEAALGDIVLTYTRPGTEFADFEELLMKYHGEKQLTPTDFLKYWEKGKKGLRPPELNVAVSMIDGFFSEQIDDTVNDAEKIRLLSNRGRLLDDVTNVYFQGMVETDDLEQYAQQLLDPYVRQIGERILEAWGRGEGFIGGGEQVVPGPPRRREGEEEVEEGIEGGIGEAPEPVVEWNQAGGVDDYRKWRNKEPIQTAYDEATGQPYFLDAELNKWVKWDGEQYWIVWDEEEQRWK